MTWTLPSPPRPFDRFGGIVAVGADRCVRGFLSPHPTSWIAKLNQFLLLTAGDKFENSEGESLRDLLAH